MCSVVVDGNKAANAFFKEKPSANVEVRTYTSYHCKLSICDLTFYSYLSSYFYLSFQAAYTDLEQVAWDLKTAQMEAGVDFPVHLSREAGGLVRSYTVSSIDIDLDLHGFKYLMYNVMQD